MYSYFNMQDFIVNGTKRTPMVRLEEGIIHFSGRSVPSNPALFYQPIFDWINEYNTKGLVATELIMNFEYINTASTKWVFNILKILGKADKAHEKLKVTWYFEEGDDDMFDLGNIFQSLVPTKFKFIETKEKAIPGRETE